MNRRRAAKAGAALLVASTLAAGVTLRGGGEADAQKLDPRRPAVLVVGAPRGASPTARVDARRSGTAREVLPTGMLRIAWRKTVGLGTEHPALVGARGEIAFVSARGDVVFLGPDGEERGQVSVGSGSAGPATLASDGTVVFATSTGEVAFVRRGSARPKAVTRIGGERSVRAAPLALDDGGVVVATATDLVAVDAEGGVRARASLPEVPGAALVSSGDRVLVVSVTGTVHGWVPGRDPVRLGSFGGPVDGGVALLGRGALLGVVEGSQLVEVDLGRGARTTRSVATPGAAYLGPPAVRGDLATVLVFGPARTSVLTLDPAGQELLRVPLAPVTAQALPDGGSAPAIPPPHVGAVVDPRGAVAYASPDGRIGVVAPDGSKDELGDPSCSRAGRSAGIAGLSPAGRGAFLITCEAGVVVKVVGPEAADAPSP